MPEEIGDDGIQLTSTSLVVDRVILADQVLEARSLDGHIPIARKARQHASGDHARVLSGSTPSGPMTTSRSSGNSNKLRCSMRFRWRGTFPYDHLLRSIDRFVGLERRLCKQLYFNLAYR